MFCDTPFCDQPMASFALYVVSNGEIFNFTLDIQQSRDFVADINRTDDFTLDIQQSGLFTSNIIR